MPTRKFTPEIIQRMIADYVQWRDHDFVNPVSSVHEKYGMSKQTMFMYLRRFGIHRRGQLPNGGVLEDKPTTLKTKHSSELAAMVLDLHHRTNEMNQRLRNIEWMLVNKRIATEGELRDPRYRPGQV